MSFGEGIKIALFCVGMVFTLLTTIYVLIKLTSAIIFRYFSGEKTKS